MTRISRTFITRCLVSAVLVVLGTFVSACTGGAGGASPATIRVMTYNIAAGGGDLDRTAGVIRSARVDVVGLQEVDVHWSSRSQFVDQATRLGERLQMEVCFAPIYQLPGAGAGAPVREYGVALLNRGPIRRCTNHPLTRLSTQDSSAGPVRMPGLLEAEVQLGDVWVRVFNTHLDYRPDPAVRHQQVAEMLDYIGRASSPTLLTGDLNATSDAAELAPLFEALRDVWPASRGAGSTYPADAPTKRIDYVLASPHFRVIDALVVEGGVSDHRGVVAEVRWEE